MAERVVLAPQEGKQTLAMNVEADVIFYGGAAGSGKSRLLLMRPLRYVGDPNFEGIFFRKNTTQLTGAGGLWPESKKIYSHFKPRVREKDLQQIFKSGATLNFKYLDHENDAQSHMGLQYSFIGFDELTTYSSTQFTYLLSRLRSAADMNSFCLGTCNPDPDSWVIDWIKWYLDELGFPREDRCGVVRYFYVIEDRPVFRNTKEELYEEYPELGKILNPVTGEILDVPPKSFCFINGTIFDNPALIAANPKYLSELMSLPKVEKDRLLHGNWYARAKGSNYFKRESLIKVEKVPDDIISCRAWDKASQEPSEVNRSPDYTACSPKFSKCANGMYWLEGDYSPETNDDDSEQPSVLGRFRRTPGERDRRIEEQARADGKDTTVIFGVDPGQAGKVEFQESAKKILEAGFDVRADPMPTNKSKVVKFSPFSAACEAGLVHIVENTFNPETLAAFYTENEAFCGNRSTSTRKDDWPDSCASAFNWLASKRFRRIVLRNQQQDSTPVSELIKSNDEPIRV